MTRIYTPTIGDSIRLKLFSDYTQYNLPAWSKLTCTGIDGNNVVCVQSLTANGAHDGELVTVQLGDISAPIGWKERYSIRVSPDKVSEVLAWLSRGIVVRQSQYIGDGSTAFQPLDNSGAPHWKFGEVTDVLTPEQTTEFVEIVQNEYVYDAFIGAPCQYCNGTGIHTTNPSLEEQTANPATCSNCGVHTGFSFTEPYHFENNYFYNGGEFGQCSHVYKPGECWVCNGTGRGARYLSAMTPKERKTVIASLELQGYKIWYERRGQHWAMERDTVIKPYGAPIPSAPNSARKSPGSESLPSDITSNGGAL